MPDLVQSSLWKICKDIFFKNEKLEKGWDLQLVCFETVKDKGQK